MKNILIFFLSISSIVVRAQTILDTNNVLPKVDALYNSPVTTASLNCADHGSYEKYLHGFSYDCSSGTECTGAAEMVGREGFNLTYFGCGGSDPYLVSTYGDSYQLNPITQHKNMIRFFLNEMLKDYFYEAGTFKVVSLNKTKFKYYEGFSFEKEVNAYELEVKYYPIPGNGYWDLVITFDPNQAFIKQILKLEIAGNLWFKLMFI